MPRNRELMRVFKDVGLVDQLGSGMDRILKVYDRNIFQFFDHIIKVNFPIKSSSITAKSSSIKSTPKIVMKSTSKSTPKIVIKSASKSTPIKLNNTQLEIIGLIQINSKISQKEIADKLNLSIWSIKKSMKKMVELKIIEREGSSRKGGWVIVIKE